MGTAGRYSPTSGGPLSANTTSSSQYRAGGRWAAAQHTLHRDVRRDVMGNGGNGEFGKGKVSFLSESDPCELRLPELVLVVVVVSPNPVFESIPTKTSAHRIPMVHIESF